jgi:hypothetical protein
MATLDLTDEEKLALAAELKHTIADDRYPLSPRNPHPAGHTQQASSRRQPGVLEALLGAVPEDGEGVADMIALDPSWLDGQLRDQLKERRDHYPRGRRLGRPTRMSV